MAAVAPGHIGQIGSDVLLLAARRGVRLSEPVEAEAVKGAGARVEGFVEADGMRGDPDLRVGGDDEAVGEAEVFAHEALVGD